MAEKINQSDFNQLKEADFLEALLAKAENVDELLTIVKQHLRLNEEQILLLLYPGKAGDLQTNSSRILSFETNQS